MKVAVCGYYGHGNFGDALVLEGLKQLFKGWHMLVYSDKTIDFDAINGCDLFVLGGGELIRETCLFMHTPSVLTRKRLTNSAYCRTPFHKYSWVHKIKIPKVVLGCGVNADSPSDLSPWVIDGLNQFSYIGVRDKTSLAILKAHPQLRYKVGLFYDLAFAVETDGYIWQPKKNQAVVVPTDRFSRGDRGVRQACIADKSRLWLTEKLKPYSKAVFLPFGVQDNNDYETCKVLADCSSYSEVLHPSQVSFKTVATLISESAATIPYRLHGMILAHMLGAKCEFYPYHWKLGRVYDAIKGVSAGVIRRRQLEVFELEVLC